MAPNIQFTVEDLRTPEGTELVLQQFRNAINRTPAAVAAEQKKFSLSDLSPSDIADLAKLIRDQLQAPGAAPLNLQDLPGTPASSGPSIPSGSIPTLVVGTLSPNTKPFLTILNIYQVIFYATDFDHCYLWTGLTWIVIERTVGAICWFSAAPTTNGWHLSDGTAGVAVSTTAGGTTTVTVPDLISGNPYIRGGNAYSGPTATAAIAPTISGSTGIESVKHTHNTTATGSVTTTGTLPAHEHETVSVTTTGTAINPVGGTAWLPTGDITGNTGNTDVDHVHSAELCVDVGPPDSTVNMDGSTIIVADGFHGHHGSTSGNTDAVSGGLSHHHDGSSLTWTQTSGQHFHDVSGQLSGPIHGSAPALTLSSSFTGNSVTSGLDSVDHTHTGSSLTVSATGEPLHMTLLPYYRL